MVTTRQVELVFLHTVEEDLALSVRILHVLPDAAVKEARRLRPLRHWDACSTLLVNLRVRVPSKLAHDPLLGPRMASPTQSVIVAETAGILGGVERRVP